MASGAPPPNPAMFAGGNQAPVVPSAPAFTYGGGGAPIPNASGIYGTVQLYNEAKRLEKRRSETLGFFNEVPGQGAWVYTGEGYRKVEEMVSEFEAMPIKQKKSIAKRLAMAGFLDAPYAETLEEIVNTATLMDLTSAYGEFLTTASARFAQGQQITPDELLEMNIRYNMSGVLGKDADLDDLDKLYDKATGKSDKPHTEVTKQQAVDIWSPEDARGLARATLQQALQRDPTEAEYEDFIAALQAEQRNNPVVTTTRSRYDAEGNLVRESSTSTGGLGEYGTQEFAQEYAESRPGFAEWQAIGTYLPWLEEALGAAVEGA